MTLLTTKKRVRKHYKRTKKHGGAETSSTTTFRELLTNTFYDSYKTHLFGKNDKDVIQGYLGQLSSKTDETLSNIDKLLRGLNIILYTTQDQDTYESLKSKEALKGAISSDISDPKVVPLKSESNGVAPSALEFFKNSSQLIAFKTFDGKNNKHVLMLLPKSQIKSKVNTFQNQITSQQSTRNPSQPKSTQNTSQQSTQTPSQPRPTRKKPQQQPNILGLQLEEAIAKKINSASPGQIINGSYKAAKIALKSVNVGLKAMKQFGLNLRDLGSLTSGIVSKEILDKVGYPNPPSGGITIEEFSTKMSNLASNISKNPETITNLTKFSQNVMNPRFIANIKDPNVSAAISVLETPEFSSLVQAQNNAVNVDNAGGTADNAPRNGNVPVPVASNNVPIPVGNVPVPVASNNVPVPVGNGVGGNGNVPVPVASNNVPIPVASNNVPIPVGNVHVPVGNVPVSVGNAGGNGAASVVGNVPVSVGNAGGNGGSSNQGGGARKKKRHTKKKRVTLHKKRKVSKKHK